MKTLHNLRLTLLVAILASLPLMFMHAEPGNDPDDYGTCCPSEDSLCYFTPDLNFPDYYAQPPGKRCTPPGDNTHIAE